jgi:hypothetical protein
MTDPEILDISVRAWTGSEAVPRPRPQRRHKPTVMVVFDTETDLSLRQNLIVAAYRYVQIRWKGARPTLTVVEEGLAYPDGDEETRRFLQSYSATHPAEVDEDAGGSPNLLVLSRHEFCERMIWRACFLNEVTLAGLNLPFDISRLALSWHPRRTPARRPRKGQKGQPTSGETAEKVQTGPTFVLRLWEHNGSDNRFRPNVLATRLDNRRTLLHFTGVADPPHDAPPPKTRQDHLLDLRTLAFAHTNASHSLESACDTFGVPYKKRDAALGTLSHDLIDYCREDVAATTTLAGALLEIHHRHPIPVSADRAFSPAALALGYMRKMNVRPPRGGWSK